MNIGRFIVRMIVSWFLGGIATGAAFCLVALATGQLAYGIHSSVAAVLLVFPVFVIVACRVLARTGFPPA